jgi:uncharacterized CHY-type Zn-finger protein
MRDTLKTSWTLWGLSALFCAIAAAFLTNLWGKLAPLPPIPLVDPQFTNTATVRQSYADKVKANEDVSMFDCYVCHDRNKPLKLKFDANFKVILPDVHEDIVMNHGSHNRNNNCFNCHDETNLEQLQTRDGQAVKLTESMRLCGSCHGPTYRDWEAGVHGRTSGYWDRQLGPMDRKLCVNCHNPHAPAFPSRAPAPGPHPLRPTPTTSQAHPAE